MQSAYLISFSVKLRPSGFQSAADRDQLLGSISNNPPTIIPPYESEENDKLPRSKPDQGVSYPDKQICNIKHIV